MKPNLRFSLSLCFFTLFAFFSLNQLAGQNCVISNLSQTSTNRVSGHSNTGQSFTAPCGGFITEVKIRWQEDVNNGSNLNDRLLIIRDGGLCTSPILHQQVIPFNSIVVGINTFTLTTPVAINNGEMNSWEITDSGQTGNAAFGVMYNASGNYTGGNSWYSCSQLTGFDASFEVMIGIPAPIVNLGNDTTFCQGPSLTLDAGNPGNSFLWSTGDTTQTITVNTSGTYSVTVTDSAGNSGSDTIMVTVAPLPTVNLGADTAFCDGGQLTLDAGNPGSSYIWSTGDTSQTITVGTTGSYSVSVQDSNGCPAFDAINVTVNPNPVVNVGPDRFICDGDTACLSVGTGGINCVWSNGSTVPTICISTGGTYTVTCTDNNMCSGSDTVIVTVNPPVIVDLGPDQDGCTGDTICLDAGTGGVAYTWNTGSTGQINCVTQSGIYVVTCTDSAGCDGSDSVTVNILSPAVATIGTCDTTNCPDVAFTDASTDATSWNWDFGDGMNSTNQNPTHTYLLNGSFIVSLVAGNQCGSDTTTKELAIGCYVGIEEAWSAGVAVYPNPTRGTFYVDLSNLHASTVQFTVYAADGRTILVHELERFSGDHTEEIDLGQVSQGVYVLKIQADDRELMHRIVVTD